MSVLDVQGPSLSGDSSDAASAFSRFAGSTDLASFAATASLQDNRDRIPVFRSKAEWFFLEFAQYWGAALGCDLRVILIDLALSEEHDMLDAKKSFPTCKRAFGPENSPASFWPHQARLGGWLIQDQVQIRLRLGLGFPDSEMYPGVSQGSPLPS